MPFTIKDRATLSRIAVCYILHDDASYLAASIASFKPAGDVFAFVSKLPWNGEPGDWERAERVARDAGAEVVVGEWATELEHRQAALAYLRGESIESAEGS